MVSFPPQVLAPPERVALAFVATSEAAISPAILGASLSDPGRGLCHRRDPGRGVRGGHGPVQDDRELHLGPVPRHPPGADHRLHPDAGADVRHRVDLQDRGGRQGLVLSGRLWPPTPPSRICQQRYFDVADVLSPVAAVAHLRSVILPASLPPVLYRPAPEPQPRLGRPGRRRTVVADRRHRPDDGAGPPDLPPRRRPDGAWC